MTEIDFAYFNYEHGGLDDGSDKRLLRQLAMLADMDADCWAFQFSNRLALCNVADLRFYVADMSAALASRPGAPIDPEYGFNGSRLPVGDRGAVH
jgi:hypothetical protein